MKAKQEYLWIEAICMVLEQALHKKLDDMGFVQSTSDPCVYKKDSGGDIFIIGVYVDDIVLAGRTDKEMRKSRLLLLLHLTSRIWAISFTIFLV